MKGYYIVFLFIFFLQKNNAQEWNSNGDNSTSGNVYAKNLLYYRGVISTDELDIQNLSGVYRVQYSGYSDALLDVSGITGSTPGFQLKANYNDQLYFRAARDNETNWDNKGFRRVVLANEEGARYRNELSSR